MNLQSRKFVISVLLVVASSAFFGADLMNKEEWSEFNRWIMGLYIGGNIGTKVVQKLEQGLGRKKKKREEFRDRGSADTLRQRVAEIREVSPDDDGHTEEEDERKEPLLIV